MKKIRFYLTAIINCILFAPSVIFVLFLLKTFFTGSEYDIFGSFIFGIVYFFVYILHTVSFFPTILFMVNTKEQKPISPKLNIFIALGSFFNGCISIFALWFSFNTYGMESIWIILAIFAGILGLIVTIFNIIYISTSKA